MSIFGLNVLAQYVHDRAALMNTIALLKPKATLVMDEPNLAQQIKALYPSMLVIHRTYHHDDTSWQDKMTAQEWLNAHAPIAANGVVLQAFNEPAPGNIPKFLTWLIELMRLAKARGVKLAVYAAAVGNPNEIDIGNGVYDRLIYELADGYHWLMTHEYFRVDPINEDPFLCNRFTFWHKRADALKIPRPKIVIGEFGRDLGGGLKDGWRDTGWSEDQYVEKMIAATRFYKPFGIPLCIFCYGRGAGDRWRSFDIQDAGTVLSRIIAFNSTFKYEEENQVPSWLNHNWGARIDNAVARHNGTFINLRAEPSTSSADVGDLFDGTPLSYFTNPFVGGSYRWYQVVVGGLYRYVAEINGLRFEEVSTPDPQPQPGAGLTAEQYARFVAARKLIDDGNALLRTLEEEIKPSNDGGF